MIWGISFLSSRAKWAFTLILTLGICNSTLRGQNHNLLIQGDVQTTTGDPIPYATVEICSTDSIHRTGSYTDDMGQFQIQLPSGGTYFVRISSIGFSPSFQRISVPAEQRLHFTLVQATAELEEVTVIGRKKLISIQPGGAISYNMKKDIASHTEDLLSAMRRVPMVIVDGQGNMQIKGTNKFSIYMNGKPFRSATMNPKQVLASIPASSVSKIEVITNPDASYEADSGSIIINIVTDKKKIDGYDFRIGLEGATQPMCVGDISFNLTRGSFRLSTAYNYRLDHQKEQPSGLSREIALSNGMYSRYCEKTFANGTWNIHTGRIMAEYDIDSIRTLYIDAHINYTRTNSSSKHWQYFSLGTQSDSVYATEKRHFNEGAFESNLLYHHLDSKNKKELFSLGYRFTYSPDNRYREFSAYRQTEKRYIKNLSNGGMYEHTFSLDALLFHNQSFVFKGGVLDILRFANSNPHYYTKATEDATWIESNRRGHDRLNQKFNAFAGYLNGSCQWRIFSLNAGARIEYVSSHINQPGEVKPLQEQYFNIVPRASITISPTNASQLSLSYYYGVTRPSIWVMNPYKEQVDDYKVSYGNPKLRYSRANNLSLDALLYGNEYFINFTIDYSNVYCPIYDYYWVESTNVQTLFNSYINGEKNQKIGLSSMVNYRPTTWLSLNLQGGVGWYFFKEQAQPYKKSFSYNIAGSYDITLPANYYLGGMYFYTHMPPSLQATYGHGHIYSLYVTKRLWDGLLELTLVAQSPFLKYSRFSALEQGPGFHQYRWNDIRASSIGIKASLRLNSGKKVEVKRNHSLEQSDLDRPSGVQ